MKENYIDRRKRLFDFMSEDSLTIMFSGDLIRQSADANYDFYVNNNFYYLTGIDREEVVYICEKKNFTIKESLFIKKKDPHQEKWIGKFLTAEEATGQSGIETVLTKEAFESYLIKVLSKHPYETLYLDLENHSFHDAATPAQRFCKTFIEKYPGIRITSIYHFLCELRMVKDPFEIDQIKKAISITKRGIQNMSKYIVPDMPSYTAVAQFRCTLHTEGAQTAFPTIAAAGINGTILHYVNNDNVMKSGDLVLFDLGARINQYCADISRTFPISGVFSSRQKEIYQIVLNANKRVIEACKPGMTLNQLNEIAKETLAEGLIQLGLLVDLESLSDFYYHGVSHFLGLDVHDVGDRETPLKPGCVVTVEPGLYIEEESLGIRIEDDILITESGYINLSSEIPKEIAEVEALFQS